MFLQIKKTFMKNIYQSLSKILNSIAEKHSLDYNELEELYLADIKSFISDD